VTAAPAPPGPIARLIAASAHNPLIVLVLIGALTAVGVRAVRQAPLDAIPDLSDAQVIVYTPWMGRGPQLIEDQITYPIASALVSAPGVASVRGQSMFGMSLVYAVFEDGTDLYWARSRVLEYLSSTQGKLPAGVTPSLGPDATGVGWVFEYALVDRTATHDLQAMRAIQDWNLRFALGAVKGVAEVASIGGFVKQYQVTVDPTKLLAFGVPLRDVAMAIQRANLDVGGSVLELAGHEHVISGRGYIQRKEDLELVPLKASGRGTPITVRDVGEVQLGPAQRRGIAEYDGLGEVAGGIVIMRYGQNALDVIDRVKARLAELAPTLPAGVEVVPTYDRSELIRRAIGTLRTTLIEEMVIVSLIIFAFLLHARSAIIPVLTLPVGVVLAFLPMAGQHLTANIMSLGGIAVAIGAMVDASIILIENVHRRLVAWDAAGRPTARAAAIIGAMQEVGPSIFFSLLVITAAFIPVFTLEGVEGRLFAPLAFTKTYAMGFAAVLSVTLTPALAVLLIRGRIADEHHHPVNRWLTRLYAPVVRAVVDHRRLVVGLALAAVVFTVPAAARLSSEFMPPLDEGSLLYMPTAPPGQSDAEGARVLRLMDREIKAFPEVASVFGKNGRAETATDPAPLGMLETTITLKPRDQWRPGMTPARLIRELDAKLHYPGMPNLWWMPIQTRTEMLSTGVRSKLAVEVFGDDQGQIEAAAIAVERAVAAVPGTRSAVAERATGGAYIDIVPRRADAARYGIAVADIDDVVETAIGGATVSETVEGRQRYPISVRYARELRDDPDALGRILIATAQGAQVPLAEVADVTTVTGPPMIRSEDGKLVGFVSIDTDRPIADYVADARPAVDRAALHGARVAWVGQYTYLERARARLRLVVPITLAIVVFLLYLSTRSLVETGIVLLAVPFSLVGAIWILTLLGYSVSVAVWVGVIALAGLDAETGVVMLLYLTLAHRARVADGRLRTFADLREAIVEGAAHRIRPKLMTVLTMMIGLCPVLWSTGTGADVMKRIAAPMIGGLVTSFLLELTVYPAIFAMWQARHLPPPEDTPPPAP
jgi:copper/silver efflux system protein